VPSAALCLRLMLARCYVIESYARRALQRCLLPVRARHVPASEEALLRVWASVERARQRLRRRAVRGQSGNPHEAVSAGSAFRRVEQHGGERRIQCVERVSNRKTMNHNRYGEKKQRSRKR